MDKKELIDRLDRAYEMEESMVTILIGLCNLDTVVTDLSPAINEKVRNILLDIRKDSIRHKNMVLEIKNGLK